MAEGMKREPTQDEINEARRRVVVEKMQLNYMNNTLLELGKITPRQHRIMRNWISTRKPKVQER